MARHTPAQRAAIRYANRHAHLYPTLWAILAGVLAFIGMGLGAPAHPGF